MTAVQQWWGMVNRGDRPASTFFLEDFEAGLGAYTTLSGNPALWSLVASPYGSQALRMASATGGPINRIQRAVPTIEFNRMQAKFRVTARNADDGGLISLLYLGTPLFAFGPVREAVYDGARRPWIQVSASDSYSAVGTTYVAENVWYRLTVQWLGGSSGVRILITNADTGAVFLDTTRAGTFPLPTVDAINLYDDNVAGASATEWDDIYLYTE